MKFTLFSWCLELLSQNFGNLAVKNNNRGFSHQKIHITTLVMIEWIIHFSTCVKKFDFYKVSISRVHYRIVSAVFSTINRLSTKHNICIIHSSGIKIYKGYLGWHNKNNKNTIYIYIYMYIYVYIRKKSFWRWNLRLKYSLLERMCSRVNKVLTTLK